MIHYEMRYLLFSIIAFSMIGLIFPSGFSEIYVHESAYPFSISHPSGWEALDEDEWGGVSIDPDKTGRNGFYITLWCSESRGEDCGQAGADYQEINFLKEEDKWYCENANFTENHLRCFNYEVIDEFAHQLDGYRAFTIVSTSTLLQDGKDPLFPDATAGVKFDVIVTSTHVLVGNDVWLIVSVNDVDKFDQQETEKILSSFMINNVYANEDIFYEPTWFENLINAIMSIFGGGTSDSSSVIIEIPTIEDPFMDPNIDWDNPIIIDPRGFDDLFP